MAFSSLRFRGPCCVRAVSPQPFGRPGLYRMVQQGRPPRTKLVKRRRQSKCTGRSGYRSRLGQGHAPPPQACIAVPLLQLVARGDPAGVLVYVRFPQASGTWRTCCSSAGWIAAMRPRGSGATGSVRCSQATYGGNGRAACAGCATGADTRTRRTCLERHLTNRQTYKERRSAALAGGRCSPPRLPSSTTRMLGVESSSR